MPVLKIYFSRLHELTGLRRETVVERLPFLGLDIEGEDSETISVEYSPNRPDFSTDYGISRALVGVTGKEVGLPEYSVKKGNGTVKVDRNLSKVRPYISCAVARGLRMDDETIRQLISMQEDLHNGIARRRKKAAIGLHNLDVVHFPLAYYGAPPSFEFVPLGSGESMTVERILRETETGRQYGAILKGAPISPILADAAGTVLSFPPIINGETTRVDTRTKNLFVDVTSTDQTTGEDALAIICAALSDAGASLESVQIEYPDSKILTPDLSPTRMKFDPELTAQLTGLLLDRSEMAECLARSRIGLDSRGVALIPRYRADVIHPVDLAEEVVIGYGLDNISALYPPSPSPGQLNPTAVALDRVSEAVAMAGFIETCGFDLVDTSSLYTKFSRPAEKRLEVENPKTMDHSVLRDSILPSLMDALSRNVQASYPQRIYEVGKVFVREGSRVAEPVRLSALVAHSSATFSEAKTYLDALLSSIAGEQLKARPAAHWAFADGRSAEVWVRGAAIGHLGEVKPSAVAAFGLDVPVAGYEIDLSSLL